MRNMKIGIIGAGMIGGTLARLLAPLGHDVAVSNSRGPASLQGMVAEIGPRAQADQADMHLVGAEVGMKADEVRPVGDNAPFLAKGGGQRGQADRVGQAMTQFDAE